MNNSGIRKKIGLISYTGLSPEEIRKMSAVNVITADTYDDEGYPIERGLMDMRMGVIEPGLRCKTCGCKVDECSGHFGHVELARPVIHVGFVNNIKSLLEITCSHCGRLLFTPEQIQSIQESRDKTSALNKRLEYKFIRDLSKVLYKKSISKTAGREKMQPVMDISVTAAKNITCPYCQTEQKKLKWDKPTTFREIETNNKLTPQEIREWLERIPDEDLRSIGMDPAKFRPEWMVLTVLPVPPVTVRPSITLDSGERSEDDLTHKLVDVIRINERLRENRDAGAPQLIVEDLWELLQYHITTYFDNQTSGIPPARHRSGRALKTLNQRLKGKEGRFRSNLSGKRVDFSARTVISPDPLLSINDVGIPTAAARELTVPVHINDININYCRNYVRKGINPVQLIEASEAEMLRSAGYHSSVFDLETNEVSTDYKEIIADSLCNSFNEYPYEKADVDALLAALRPENYNDLESEGQAAVDERCRQVFFLELAKSACQEVYTEADVALLKKNLLEVSISKLGADELCDRFFASFPDAEGVSSYSILFNVFEKGEDGRSKRAKRTVFCTKDMSDEVFDSIRTFIDKYKAPVCASVLKSYDNMLDWIYIFRGSDVDEYEQSHSYNFKKKYTFGVNYICKPDGRRIRLNDKNCLVNATTITSGYILSRQLVDGDVVLFNRQPSLHRMSMMAHRVRVMEGRTFRFNLCVCPPYNADFDGDEMNLHVLQSEEARAEARILMQVQENILSPRYGGPIIGAIHDHITGAYFLTNGNKRFYKEEAMAILTKLDNIQIPEPLKDENGVDYWTGKQLFSIVLPDDFNVKFKAAICKGCKECLKEKCENDAYVKIVDGQLVCGTIDVKGIGNSKGKILDRIARDYGSARGAQFINQVTRLALGSIMARGFSTGIDDEDIPEQAKLQIKDLNDEKIQEVEKLIESYEDGTLEQMPGRTLKQTLEVRAKKVLEEARDGTGEIAGKHLGMRNPAVIMAKTGARGNMLNLSQMAGCVGQQSVRGERISRGYAGRTLPHFRRGDLGAFAKGFVTHSYKQGLSPTEFFFHAMGGREGLVDTAVRTSRSGYLQRKLVTAFIDLKLMSDYSVRDSDGNIIQFMYGEDGADPAKAVKGKILDLDDLFTEVFKDDDTFLKFDSKDVGDDYGSKEDDTMELEENEEGDEYEVEGIDEGGE